MRIFPVQCLLALIVAHGGTAQADVFQIRDTEGFDRSYVAKAAKVPEGWTSTGRIAWVKPCSGNDLFETLFTTHAQDGTAGARIMPGYQFLHNRAWLTPGYASDPILNMMLAESEAANRQLETQFRGSNCGTAHVQGSASVLDNIILPKRPADTRVLQTRVDQTALDALRQSLGGGMSGMSISFDARIVDLGYRHNGIAVTERIYLSWYSFEQQPTDLGGVTFSSVHTIVEPLRIVWSPHSRSAELLPKLETILHSIRTNPAWQVRVDEVYKALAEQRDTDRARRETESDRRHKEFIEMITEGGSSVDAGATATGAPGRGSGAASGTGADGGAAAGDATDTDFWGNPKPKTDFWGDPIDPGE